MSDCGRQDCSACRYYAAQGVSLKPRSIGWSTWVHTRMAEQLDQAQRDAAIDAEIKQAQINLDRALNRMGVKTLTVDTNQ